MYEADGADWATVANETFNYNVVPWAGRRYVEWVKAWSRPHPLDPGLVQLPKQMWQAYKERPPATRMTRQVAENLGYPGVPGERELDDVRRELKEALGRGDWEQAHDLDRRLRELQERVAGLRASALKR